MMKEVGVADWWIGLFRRSGVLKNQDGELGCQLRTISRLNPTSRDRLIYEMAEN